MFEAFKVGVLISMTNHVSPALAAMRVDFKGAAADAELLGAKIKAIHSMALKGTLLAGAGALGLGLLKVPYEEAKKLAMAQANFATLNLSAMDNAQMFAKAATMAHQILGTAITGNVQAIHDLHTAFGDLPHAIKTADVFAKFGFVAKVMNGGKPVEGLVYNAAKALEHRGGKLMNNDVEFKSELDMMEGVYLGSRGKVNPSEFFHASQTGKMFYTLMAKDELYGQFAAYVQAKTGTTAGTTGMTFISSMLGGHMTNKAKGFMSELGLWDEGVSPKRMKILGQITKGMSLEERKNMGLLMPTAGGLKDQFVDLAVHHGSEFVQKVMAPAIRKRFGLDMTDEQVAVKVVQAFNRGTSDYIGEFILNAVKFAKDATIFGNSKRGESAYQHYLRSPQGAESAAGAAWESFLAVFGSIYLPTITKGLLKLASALDSLRGWVERNQMLTKVLAYAFAGLSGALLFSGSVLLLKSAFWGLGLIIGGAGGAGLVGTIGAASLALGKAGLAGAAIVGVVEIGRLALAIHDLFGAKNRTGVHLTPEALAQASANRDALAHMDKDFRATGGSRSVGGKVSYVQPGNSAQKQAINNLIVMPNGEVLAKVVTRVQAKHMNQPPTGARHFDGSMGPRPVAMGN